jgi:hypothetical protein
MNVVRQSLMQALKGVLSCGKIVDQQMHGT